MRKCWEMGGKMDLRIEKTERGIKNAFIELRSRKPLEKITVKELCESARINKSTFYAHYKDNAHKRISTICQMRWKKK